MPITERLRIARALGRGLSGYVQHQIALGAGTNLSELHLQFVAAQVLERAIPGKPVYVNKVPDHWRSSTASDDRSLDLASGNQRAWRYIAEMKYFPDASTVSTNVREATIQDAARLATVPLAITDAATDTGRFLILCFRARMSERFTGRYDTGITGILRSLFSFDDNAPAGSVSRATLQSDFRDWQQRTPTGWKLRGRAGLTANLLVSEPFKDLADASGLVGIWHCS